MARVGVYRNALMYVRAVRTGLGTMAGEIEQPEVVFPKAIAILIPTLATVSALILSDPLIPLS